MDAVPDIFQLTMMPFGNGQETKKANGSYTFNCQHGPSECVGNLLEACGIYYHNSSKEEWFPYIYCIEHAALSKGLSPAAAAPLCAKSAGWTDYDTNILPCASNSFGNGLMHGIAAATNALKPDHEWVPWVVLNGKPLSDKQLDLSLITLICQAYTGTPPAKCSTAALAPRASNASLISGRTVARTQKQVA